MILLPLGPSGLRVSELSLGTGTFGNTSSGCDETESKRIYLRYREAGGNFIDTANKYADGQSEEILGRLTKSERDQVVIGTKFTAAHPGSFADNPNSFGNHAKSLRLSLRRSLTRLQTDYVDVLWVHAWDPRTAIVEMMRTLHEQVRAGNVLVLGASNMPSWVVATANAIASSNGWTPFSAIQVEYSLLQRGAERELFPMAGHGGLATMAWAPLGLGILSGKYLDKDNSPRRLELNHPKLDQRADAIAREVSAIAEARGLMSPQVALAWVRAQTSAPIVLLGARNLSQVEDNLEVVDIVLDSDDLERLDRVSAIDRGVPDEFLSSDDGIDFFYGAEHPQTTRVGAL